MGKLDGKVTIITGAAGGIGQAAARLFSEEGSKLMLVDVNEEVLADTVKTIGEDKASYTVADVTKVESVESYLRKTLEIFGQIDVTLLNAGIEGKIASILEQSDEDFDNVLAVNTKGVWLGLKYTMKVMATNGGGSIVITS
jgi:3alpha(or 20beta)-hydroxysteroid dehydrogenase